MGLSVATEHTTMRRCRLLRPGRGPYAKPLAPSGGRGATPVVEQNYNLNLNLAGDNELARA